VQRNPTSTYPGNVGFSFAQTNLHFITDVPENEKGIKIGLTHLNKSYFLRSGSFLLVATFALVQGSIGGKITSANSKEL